MIFWSDRDRLKFSTNLREYLNEFGFDLYAAVLMDNHFHLLIKISEPTLPLFMQRLLTSYAMYVRKVHGRSGHLFQGRYHAKIVQDEQYLIRLSRYLHLNPIKTKSCQNMGSETRLKNLNNFHWSTYRAYIGASPPPSYLNLHILTYFGDSPQEAQLNYRNYVEDGLISADESLATSMKASSIAIGNDEYIQSVERAFRNLTHRDHDNGEIILPHHRQSLPDIESAVCQYFDLPPHSLKEHGIKAGPAKAVAVELACRWSGETTAEIGAYFGGITGQAVSKIRQRLKQRKPSDLLEAMERISRPWGQT